MKLIKLNLIDDFTKQHLAKWCANFCISEDEANNLYWKILGFIKANPYILNKNYSWLEIKTIVERKI